MHHIKDCFNSIVYLQTFFFIKFHAVKNPLVASATVSTKPRDEGDLNFDILYSLKQLIENILTGICDQVQL